MPLPLPKPEVTVLRRCGVCHCEIGSYTVKLDNLLLVSREEIWCPDCQASCPELREVAGKRAAVEKETTSYPPNLALEPTPPPNSTASGNRPPG